MPYQEVQECFPPDKPRVITSDLIERSLTSCRYLAGRLQIREKGPSVVYDAVRVQVDDRGPTR